jgi:predicted DNA-binding transcriptional regulator YafY
MHYQRSLAIERRLKLVLELIRTSTFSTPKLADRVGVSIPTISRDVTALRERGYDIRSEKRGNSWQYVFFPKQSMHPFRDSIEIQSIQEIQT